MSSLLTIETVETTVLPMDVLPKTAIRMRSAMRSTYVLCSFWCFCSVKSCPTFQCAVEDTKATTVQYKFQFRFTLVLPHGVPSSAGKPVSLPKICFVAQSPELWTHHNVVQRLVWNTKNSETWKFYKLNTLLLVWNVKLVISNTWLERQDKM